MNFKILGDSDCPLVHIELRTDETIKLERGAMAYISNAHLEGKMNSSKKGFGGVLSAIGRSITSGESMFITHATGESEDAYVGAAPAIPGKIHCLHVDANKQYRLNTGAFLACDDSVEYVMKSQEMASTYASYGWGTFTPYSEVTDHKPGDIFSNEGHVYISLGTCDDGSVLLVHSSPPGVRICGFFPLSVSGSGRPLRRVPHGKLYG